MHVTRYLAERYVSEGYDLDRPPLAPPFQFLATGPDGSRVAGFASDAEVTAEAVVDARHTARDLGAAPVFAAPGFTIEARRLAERFGMELLESPVEPGFPDGPPAAAPPEPEPVRAAAWAPPPASALHGAADVPPPFPELADVLPVDPILAAEARAHPDFADFPEDPTPEELREELRHVNAELDRPVARAPPAEPEADEFEAGPAPQPLFAVDAPPLDADLARATEAHLAESATPEELAAWYDDLCALEARARDEDLAAWYDALCALEARVLAEELEDARLVAEHDLLALAAHARALRPATAFDPRAGAARALREVEAAVPAPAAPPAPAPALVWPDLAPLARASGVLVPARDFGASAAGAFAFRAVEEQAPAFGFHVVAEPEPPRAPAVVSPVEAAPWLEDPPEVAVAAVSAVPAVGAVPTVEVEAAPDLGEPLSVSEPPADEPVLGEVPDLPVLGESVAEAAPDPEPQPEPVAEPEPVAAPEPEPQPEPVAASEPVEAPKLPWELPAPAASPFLAPRSVLPWTPVAMPPPQDADARLFHEAFARAEARAADVAARLEGVRRDAHDAVMRATDVPKAQGEARPAPDPDFELL